MKHFRRVFVTTSLLGMVVILACSGGSEDPDSPGAGGSSLEDMPYLSESIKESSNASLVSALALNGASYATTTEQDFEAEDSLGFCHAFNLTRQLLSEIVFPDLIRCFADVVSSNNSTINSAMNSGEAFSFGLDLAGFDGAGDGECPDHITMQFDGSGNFTMKTCCEGSQEEYLSYTLTDDGSVDATSKGNFDYSYETPEGGPFFCSGDFLSDVTGSVDNDGDWTSKTIVSRFNNNCADDPDDPVITDDRYGETTLVQTQANAFELSGFEAGVYTTNAGENTHANSLAGFGQIITGNDPTSMLDDALGDVAMSVMSSGTFDGGDDEQSFVHSASGDSFEEVTSNDFTTAAEAASPPTAEEVTIAPFSGSEVTSCDETELTTVVMADYLEDLQTTCVNLALDHEWIDCWEIMGN